MAVDPRGKSLDVAISTIRGFQRTVALAEQLTREEELIGTEWLTEVPSCVGPPETDRTRVCR